MQPGDPERGLVHVILEVCKRQLERGGASDQNHVISYSHSLERRIRAKQPVARNLAEPPASPIPVDGALDVPAHGDSDATLSGSGGNGKSDECAPREHALARDHRLEIGLPAAPKR